MPARRSCPCPRRDAGEQRRRHGRPARERHGVRADAAAEIVVAEVSREQVVAGAAVQDVRPVVTDQDVVAVAAGEPLEAADRTR